MPFFVVFSFPSTFRGFLLCADRIAALSSSNYTYNLLKFVAFLSDRLASLQLCCNRNPATSIGRFNGLCEHSWHDSLREKYSPSESQPRPSRAGCSLSQDAATSKKLEDCRCLTPPDSVIGRPSQPASFYGLIRRGPQRAIGLTLFQRRTIYSTQGRYQRRSIHHRIEFKGFATRRHLEERLIEGNFSGGRSDFFFQSARRQEAFG